MHDDMEQVPGIADPVDRAKAAIDLMARYQGWVLELSRIRREAIEEAQASGLTQAEIAKRLGVSRGRVGQLASAGPPPERAFFGTDLVTVSLGGKPEADKTPEQNPSDVVAREDLDNFEHLRKLLSGMKLEAQYEVIPSTGIVNLNRENHVVVCGPRLSPIVAQVLEGDNNLRFEKDRAWHLVDQKAGKAYRSPMDENGSAGDFGYLGRLPRLDGRGTFLYIAGIHAIGANGVVHFLENNLAELYREVRTRRFSTLISCRYDPETLDVLESRRVTPLYRHEG
ncbi:sigma factor-like helix-turn-helix DNA-binding protein [Streptomyces sp. Qhu-G9]|uniref:sigma factor-like helix-turn-helix DNA-binding protein n=1 Tax=Streptomyces sp. Qhu-G9 TaxID=3452799 RepID=UPI0022AC5466|nr:sigma factor-like helix-turn-helix DNA-binding protein [Streptomyces aurantiacus]WAU85035.1 sigma factor-like helix-turn-helix DNA-binding protein [Streptomyces aurantiacus]